MYVTQCFGLLQHVIRWTRWQGQLAQANQFPEKIPPYSLTRAMGDKQSQSDVASLISNIGRNIKTSQQSVIHHKKELHSHDSRKILTLIVTKKKKVW